MTARALPFAPPDEESRPVDINVLIAADIRKRDWHGVHIRGDSNPPINVGARRWGWS